MEHAVVEVVVYLTSYPSSIVTQAQAVHVQTLDCTALDCVTLLISTLLVSTAAPPSCMLHAKSTLEV